MTQAAQKNANPVARNPQFVLRIILGLVLLLATRDVLSLFPPVSGIVRSVIIGFVGVGLPAAFLYFFDVRRRV